MASHALEVDARRGEGPVVRSGHRSAHLWVVLASAILAACVLVYGWVTFSGRPQPEPLAAAAAEAAPGARS